MRNLPRSRLGPPLLAWVAAAAAIIIAATAFGYSPFNSATWSRWDSVHYEGIARHGYNLGHCTDTYRSADWCGDAGWLPAYPWLVRAVHFVGVPLRGGAVAISWLFAAATLVLLWNTFFRRRPEAAVLGALLYATWAPGQIYHYAVFPLSMLSFFTVLHLWFLHRGRDVAAGLAGGVAALSYPLGIVLVPVSAVWLLAERGIEFGDRLRRVACASGLTLAGVGVLVLDQWRETGHWDAYLLVQDKYHHNLQNPIAATRDSLHPLLHGSPFELAKAPALQTALVTVALVAVLVWAVLSWGSLDRFDALVLLWAIPTWALPLAQADVSIQRSQAALLPLAVLARRLPRPLLIVLMVAAVPIAVAIEKLFLEGKIV